MPLENLPASLESLWSSTTELAANALTPTLRLGVTGLARSGKTVFITALIRNLITSGRLPFFVPHAEGRILSAHLEPQPDDSIPRFDYERHLAALAADPPAWPESTRRISELRVVITYETASPLRHLLGATRRLNIDIVDYPGEWLLDLAMLDEPFAVWAADALTHARAARRQGAADEFLGFLAGLDPYAPADEIIATQGAPLFTSYLHRARENEPLAIQGPGRFLMPGDLEGAPLLTFFPVDIDPSRTPPRGSLAAMMQRRYESYVAEVVRPFFTTHFSRLDRQIVLIDALGALNGGAETMRELEGALDRVLRAFRPGLASWLTSLFGGHRIDRLLFAATKADHIHHTSHDRLEAILKLLTERAGARADAAGAEIRVLALASLRATREVEMQDGKTRLPCIAGVPLPGETAAGVAFDGVREAIVFPGDLPEDPQLALDAKEPPLATFPRFRPPRILPTRPTGEVAQAPHIRLDRALDFLIGDWLT